LVVELEMHFAAALFLNSSRVMRYMSDYSELIEG
jgi:hypothetical protein